MGYLEKQRACSAQVHEDYCQYVKAMKKKADVLTTSPKQWWKLSSRLMMKGGGCSSIPPLRKSDGSWAMTPKSKADLLASTFKEKFGLPRQVVNEYTVLYSSQEKMMGGFLPVRVRVVRKILKNLDVDSSNGPDLLATRILKRFSGILAYPVAILGRSILHHGYWPSGWKIQWVIPLFKKKSRASPKNYRGVHLTPQLSKVIERIFSCMCTAFLEVTDAYGRNQFAYTRNR